MSSLIKSIWHGDLWSLGLWPGSLWESNAGILDYYLHMPTDRGSVYFRDYVSRTDAVTTIPGTRPYNGTTVPIDRPTLGADGLRGCGVVDNLITGSAPTDLTQWSGTRSSISQNQIAAPYGTDLADKLCADATADNSHYIWLTRSFTAGTTYPISIYLKASDYTWAMVNTYQASDGVRSAYYDLGTGAIGTATACTVDMQSIGNGWYLCLFKITPTVTASDYTLYLRIAEGNGDYIIAGTQTGKGIYAWGAQVTASPYKLYDNFTGTATVAEAGTTVLPLTSQMSEAMGGDGSEVGDDIPRTWGIGAGSPSIDGDVIVFSDQASSVRQWTYWTAAKVYRVNVTISGYSGTGNINLPYDGTKTTDINGVSVARSANGTYEYDYKPTITDLWIYSYAGHTATLTINSIKPLTPQATLTCAWKPMFDSGDIASGVVYESDHSIDADGWTAYQGTVAGNIDSIGGEDDWLRFTNNTANNVHVAKTGYSLTSGKAYELTFKSFLPSTNSNGLSIRAYANTGSQDLTGYLTTTDSIVTTTVRFTAAGTSVINFYLGNIAGYTDAGGDDVFYIKDVVITEISTDTLLTAGDMSLKYIAGLDQLEFSDGTNTAVKSLTCVAETAYAITAKWDGVNNLMKIGVDGVYGTETAFTGSFSPGNMTFLSGSQYQWLDDVDILKEMTW